MPAQERQPTPRQEAAARTRVTLLTAGLRLAQDVGLSALSISRIVDEAGVSKGAFFHHFPDRSSYLLALHREFHDRIRDEALQALEGETPGPVRLLKATRTYLDTCLREYGVRSLLLEARADPVTAAEVRLRNSQTAELCTPDFTALEWDQPYAAAQLWVGMAAEAALLEFDAGEKLVPLREALARYIGAPVELICG